MAIADMVTVFHQGQIIAENTGGLLGCNAGHHENVVHDGGNVVNQCEKAAGCHLNTVGVGEIGSVKLIPQFGRVICFAP